MLACHLTDYIINLSSRRSYEHMLKYDLYAYIYARVVIYNQGYLLIMPDTDCILA